jgi:hypothetical protein
MENKTIAEILQIISESYPGRWHPTKQTTQVWSRMLRDLDPKYGLAAVTELCGSGDYPPTIAQIRRTAHNLERGHVAPPSPWEAWERAIAGTPGGSIEARAIDLVGGTWAIRHGENPEVLRSQFLRCYSELLERHDREACAVTEVRQLAEDNRDESVRPERRVSEPERIDPGTPDQISALLRAGGF